MGPLDMKPGQPPSRDHPHVLFVSGVSTLGGGAERSLLDLAGGLAASGWTVSLAAWRRGDLTTAFDVIGETFTFQSDEDPASPLGGRTLRFPAIAPFVRAANWVRISVRSVRAEASWIERVAQQTGADLIHTNCDLSPLAVRRAAQRTGLPWIAHVRDYWRNWFHFRVENALKTASRIVTPSGFLAETFRIRGVSPAVIPNPVSNQRISRSLDAPERKEIRGEFGLENDTFAVAVIGRLDEQKGSLKIVEVARELTNSGETGVCFLLAGRGTPSFEDRIRRVIAQEGLNDRVRLLGHRSDVDRWLPAMDALMVPSDREPFGRMIVEGMLAGLPVIAPDDGAAPEILQHRETGLLVPAHGEFSFANALREILSDPGLAHELGKAAKAHALSRFDPKHIAAEMAQLYRTELKRNHARGT